MANIKVPRGSNASSTKPMPKANKKKSGSQKLADFKKRQSAKSKPGESPSQYRDKIKKQKAEEQKRIQEAAIGPVIEGINDGFDDNYKTDYMSDTGTDTADTLYNMYNFIIIITLLVGLGFVILRAIFSGNGDI